MEAFNEFHQILSQLQAELIKPHSQTSLNIAIRELFKLQINILVNNDYDPTMLRAFSKMAIEVEDLTIFNLLNLQLKFYNSMKNSPRMPRTFSIYTDNI